MDSIIDRLGVREHIGNQADGPLHLGQQGQCRGLGDRIGKRLGLSGFPQRLAHLCDLRYQPVQSLCIARAQGLLVSGCRRS